MRLVIHQDSVRYRTVIEISSKVSTTQGDRNFTLGGGNVGNSTRPVSVNDHCFGLRRGQAVEARQSVVVPEILRRKSAEAVGARDAGERRAALAILRSATRRPDRTQSDMREMRRLRDVEGVSHAATFPHAVTGISPLVRSWILSAVASDGPRLPALSFWTCSRASPSCAASFASVMLSFAAL